ncbi:MAG TPA: hypothetical protein VFB90_04255 [Dehalococcoidia bacterium]|nr:hypothetical protein [Dehalococcoidia bacterium]
MRALNEPVGWWGWKPDTSALSLTQLIQAGNFSPEVAALLWLTMERGGSIAVVAHPGGAGKTATLTALLSLTPPDSLAYFTRGEGEPFDLPPLDGNAPIYILVNEMSDHMPVYTWDDAARRVFELMSQGYSMGTTMHAAGPEEVFSMLRGELGIPLVQLAKLTLVVSLFAARRGDDVIRRIDEISFTDPEVAEGLSGRRLVERNAETDEFTVLESEEDAGAFADWAGLSPAELRNDLSARSDYLRQIVAAGTLDFAAVNEAIAAYYERTRG